MAPYTIKLKLLMKETLAINDGIRLDDPVSPELIQNWANVMEEGMNQDDLWFIPSCTHKYAVKIPRLFGY